jgi:hypothetical protein
MRAFGFPGPAVDTGESAINLIVGIVQRGGKED